ncbi:MAG: FadR family transcriptional regulator, partial [Litoreibacter sp.]|nr:FadR family transcriptional regulator [Litoreibacter sp.]
AGAVEAMQPLMNMITFTARSRIKIVALHHNIADALEAQDATMVDRDLQELHRYTVELAADIIAQKTRSSA